MPLTFSTVFNVSPQAGLGQDRVSVRNRGQSIQLRLSDGAGGISGGANAAEKIVDSSLIQTDWSEKELCKELAVLDRELAQSPEFGEATAISVSITQERLSIASVGDSEACLITKEEVMELTQNQNRKPLVGSGACVPVGLHMKPASGRLLMASDGLFKYARFLHVVDVVRDKPLEQAVEQLIDLARMKNGKLQDDVSVIICEIRPEES